MMLLRRLDEPPFRERTWLTSHVAFADWDDPVAVLVGVLREHGWADGRIGLELDSHYLTVERYEAIRAALPRATLVNVAPALRELRLRKSPEELAYLRRAAQIADAAMRAAIGTAGPGVGERDVAAVAGRVFLDLGADHGRAGIVTSGARSGSLHGALGDRRLERGDILHLELVPQVRGYSARLMRPTVLGAPSAPQADAARRLVEIQDEQIEAMRVGAVAREVDRVCRAQVLGAQLRETFDNVTGYTLGYYSPWGPRSSDFTRAFTPSAGWVLEAGMVFHMYVSAHGMTFSETVLVTADGPERLTRLERRLFVR
jgi:Xaa-Pro dipeptidase